MTQSIFQAQPFELPFDPRTTALVMIDMQRDFVEAGGFGEALGNDVSRVRTVNYRTMYRGAGSRTSKRNYGYSYS
ncbi:hypothetical protein EIMP300_07430 [Escherichia coli]|uniref:Isochorismatase n=1 Tax=Escherichia coli TaxID=562 RepID=A0A8S0FH40_ECOLX|nr:hypothetical protein EIMP300_07430 [Escherichia coli]